MPAFSVITVTLNNRAGLEKTYNSLKNQTFTDYEWIVVDGGSSDGTPAFLQTTPARWISEKDGGIYDAMNKGIERAAGDYLLFLNAGDCLAAPDTLEKITAALNTPCHLINRHPGGSRDLVAVKPPDFIYGDSFEDLNGQQFHKPARSHKKIALGMFTHHQAMLYHRTALGNLRYDLNYKIAADYDFTARFLKRADQVLYCPFPLCIFASGGVSQRRAHQGRREQQHIKRALKLSGPAKTRIISITQTAALLFKTTFPRLYWRIKSHR